MKLHNCYTLRTESGVITALNAMSDDYWKIVSEVPAWAKTFALIDDEGNAKTAPAELRFINCDPSRGGVLRAVYGAQIDCPPAKTYIKAALCCDSEGLREVSSADINFESMGETAEITAVIYLDIAETEGIAFMSGENPLIKRLLGCGENLPLRIGWGNCDYPSMVCARTADFIDGYGDARISFENGMTIAADGQTSGRELVLFAGDTPLMRALRPYDSDIGIAYKTVGDKSAVLISEDFPVSVYGVRIGDNAISHVDVCRVIESVGTVHGDNKVNLGSAGGVKSDPGEEYLAVTASTWLEVYKTDNTLELNFITRIPYGGEYVEMCRGGAVVLWGSSKLTIWQPDDAGEYTSFSFNIPYGDERIVVREGTRYHAAYRRGTVFIRLCIENGAYKVLEQIRVPTALFFLGRCGDAIVRGDKIMKIVTIDADISAEFSCDEVASRTDRRALKGHGDYFFVSTENGTDYVYDLIHGGAVAFGASLTANGKLLYDGTNVYIYDFYNGIRKINSMCDLSGLKGACLAGGGLFALKDGILCSYYLGGGSLAVRVPVGNAGKSFFCNFEKRLYKGLGQPAAFKLNPQSNSADS